MEATHIEPHLIGGRRLPRPASVVPCPRCGEPLGTNYATCPPCFQAIESYWLADWQALLVREGIAAGTEDETLLARVVLIEFGQHPWTVLDSAMSLLRCDSCGGELGEGYTTCGVCGWAFGQSVASEFGATANEHALHIGRWVLRYPRRHSANAVAAWRLTLPRVLTGWLPTTQAAQRAMASIKAGRMAEVQATLRTVDEAIRQANARPA